MRILLSAVLLLFVFGCGSSENIVNTDEKEKTVSLHVSGFEFENENKWFSNTSKNIIADDGLVKIVGDELLELIIDGYSDQTGDYSIAEDIENADVVIRINKLTIGQRNFTLNFVKPGPMYLMRISAEIESEEFENYTIEKKSLVNMAEVSYPDENFKWMTDEEKSDAENQLATFDVGLKKLYQNLFFEAFDISLQL